jgi:hypothetical protein
MTVLIPESETTDVGDTVREVPTWWAERVLYGTEYDVDDEVDEIEGERIPRDCLGGPGGA